MKQLFMVLLSLLVVTLFGSMIALNAIIDGALNQKPVGYTTPQHERYADGTGDWISYPIYPSQEAAQ